MSKHSEPNWQHLPGTPSDKLAKAAENPSGKTVQVDADFAAIEKRLLANSGYRRGLAPDERSAERTDELCALRELLMRYGAMHGIDISTELICDGEWPARKIRVDMACGVAVLERGTNDKWSVASTHGSSKVLKLHMLTALHDFNGGRT
jgi:hypothetical protein